MQRNQAQVLELTRSEQHSAATETVLDRVLIAPGKEHYPRARPGERLNDLFEYRCDRLRQHGYAHHLAVDDGEITLTYTELDRHANQLARYLLTQGAGAGNRIALLFEESMHFYIGMLAVLKINAAYVPLDMGFPADRISYIVADSGANMVLSVSSAKERIEGIEHLDAKLICVDEAAPRMARLNPARLTERERGKPTDELAYIIYTSGSTGRPKGVAVGHPSICNFVRVAAGCYGYNQHDRVYQGLTLAFDFSIEEIWVPWMVGATLVPRPAGASLLGEDLHEFLTSRRITAMCCVPTLLATLEEDVPLLRILLVSGEACPQDLITRWYKPDRRFLNVYGPTEATVTATWTTLHPDKPVTIGVPLPSYAIVILDPDDPNRALPYGEVGEIGIAGIGLARGYLNNPEKTEQAFIEDFLNIPSNPSGRIYRTGDLGRVNADGEIEYLGRIDLQVKIRGYRIELTEIESVLLQVPGIAAAVVDTYEPVAGSVELVGYYSLRSGQDTLEPELIYAHLRDRLPKYMVPAYLEQLAAIPMTTSDKADRKALPPPTQRASAAAGREVVAAATETERVLASTLASVLGMAEVSVDTDFFDELGASSLTLTQFSAALRTHQHLPRVSIKQMYQNPTIRRLAAQLGDTPTTTAPATPARAGEPHAAAPAAAPASATEAAVVRGSSIGYVLTGLGQLVFFLAAALLAGWVLVGGFTWAAAAPDLTQTFLRSVEFSVATFLGFGLLPVLVKYLLIDSFEAGTEIRLWSLAYLRFWIVKTLIQLNPIVLFVGSPLYGTYLRLLGVKLGKNVLLLTRTVPIATDMISIGDNTVIHKESMITGYHAEAGVLRFGPVSIGRDAFIGRHAILDINTTIEDGATLGHTSTLLPGQTIPAGQTWHGGPAEPAATAQYRTLTALPPNRLRKLVFTLIQLTVPVLIEPALFTLGTELLTKVPALAAIQASDGAELTHPLLYALTMAVGIGLYFALVGLGLAVILTVPKLLARAITPDTTYPLYGVRYFLQTVISALTNSQFFMLLFGDSAFITGYLRTLGYDLAQIIQTGSNFGTELNHESPFLTRIGTGSVVSDGLSVLNTEYSATSFRVRHITIGENNFFGNGINYPADAKIGDNVLLGTKTMIPIDGPVRSNVGLLGSPPFEIPRTVSRQKQIDYLNDPAEVTRRLAAKTRYNLRTILWVTILQAVLLGIDLILAAASFSLLNRFGSLAAGAALAAIGILNLLFAALLERSIIPTMRPQHCSIYDPYFWRHERMWKLNTFPLAAGTPFQNVLFRLAGVRLGKRVFNDGAPIIEKSLVTVGDDAILNAGAVIQCHSLEDGIFQSDYTTIGPGATLGVSAFVHYGVTIGAGAVLEADSFLIKGEQMQPGSRWHGNPATETTPTHTMITELPVQPIPTAA